MLFDLAKLGELDKPLTPKILSVPTSNIARHILYLYSMESFIYPELNKASREKDQSKIQFYGAFAAALSYIIYSANPNRVSQKLEGTTTLFRGLKLKPDELDHYNEGFKIHLIGYTSTSKSFEVG